MDRRTAWAAVFAAAAITTAVVAYVQLTTTFMPYDDEGYMLVTVREFLSGGGLYDDVYSQYGPFFGEFWAAVAGGIGLTLDNDQARVLTLFEWVGASSVLGLSVWRLTRRGVFGLVAQLVSFVALAALIREPLHPGGLICLLLSAMLAVVAFLGSSRILGAAAGLGSLLAALTLVKINVGGLAVVATMLAAAVSIPALVQRRLLTAGISCVAVLSPVAIVWGDLDKEWTQRYAFVVLAAIASVVVMAWPARASIQGSVPRTRFVAVAVAAFVATGTVICLIALATGTSAGGLVKGVLVRPLGQAGAFTVPLQLPIAAVGVAIAGLLGAVWARRRTISEPALAILSLLSGTLILCAVANPGVLAGLTGDARFMPALALAWVPLVGIRERGFIPQRHFPVIFLVALAVLQTMHAYPVAESQKDFGSFLFAAVGALCLSRAASLRSRVHAVPALAAALAVGITLAVGVVDVVRPFRWALRAHNTQPTFGISGAEQVHVPAATRDMYRDLTTAINSHCSSFLTLPGQNTLYVLTGQRPPTGFNATAWMYLFDTRDQQRIVNRVAGTRRLCVVKNSSQLSFWRQGRSVPDRPLYRFLTTGLQPIGRFGDFELARKAG